MRIIAGAYKGRKLKEFGGRDIRPTSDRTRESLFNLLMHGAYGGRQVIGCHVVDLCCGTGALGLEALSRGARMATFVDQDKRSLALARDNAAHCGATAQAHFIQADAAKLPSAREPAQLVVMDAPYASPITLAAYESLRAGGWFAPGALFVVEQGSGGEAPTLSGAALVDERRYGKATLRIYSIDG